MGIFDRLREGAGVQRPLPEANITNEQAIARYRYMLRTAPPETIEQAHAEAFAQLAPEQRQRVLEALGSENPEAARAQATGAAENPEQLARIATRAEIRQPGVMERVFGGLSAGPGGMSAGPGMGTLFGASFLSSMAGTVIGSLIAQQFFGHNADAARLFEDSLGPGSGDKHSSDHASATSDDDSSAGDTLASSDLDNDSSGFDGGSFDA